MTSKQDDVDSQPHACHSHTDDQKRKKTGDPVVAIPTASTTHETQNGRMEITKRQQAVVDADYDDFETHCLKRQRAIDPDYEEISDQPSKRQRVIEEDAKEATKRKIERIIQTHFSAEIHNKQSEINIIDQRLNQSRVMMDRLRACIVANFYGTASQQGLSKGKHFSAEIPSIHPAVKKHLGKAPVCADQTLVSQSNLPEKKSSAGETTPVTDQAIPAASTTVKEEATASLCQATEVEHKSKVSSSASASRVSEAKRGSRFRIKKKIIVGNVSKFIPIDRRDVNDQASHKWMVYVRGPQDEPKINDFVKKVWFFLHPSYRPNDLVEISQPPFHLTRRGWGEFPVRVQLHFWDSRNKRVDIIHQLVLDKTCTGLQTLGSETVVEIELEKEEVEERLTNSVNVPVASENKKKTRTRSGKTSPRKRFKSESKGENCKLLSDIKQEPILDVANAEATHGQNASTKLRAEKRTHGEMTEVKSTENANRRTSECYLEIECGNSSYKTGDAKRNVSGDAKQNISENGDGIGLSRSHRKTMKLKEKTRKNSDTVCSSVVNSSTVESNSSPPSLEKCSDVGEAGHVPTAQKQANVNNNHNGVLCSVNSQGKTILQGKDATIKSNVPKVSLLNKTTMLSPKSQMYIKSMDEKGNVVLQLIGERSPIQNSADSLLLARTGQVSLLDGKKKSCSDGRKGSDQFVVASNDVTTLSTVSPVRGLASPKSTKPLVYSLTTPVQMAASCDKTSDSVSKSSVVTSSLYSALPQSDVNSINRGGAPVSIVNSTQSSGVPVCDVNPTLRSVAPVLTVNSTYSIGAPQSDVNSTHIGVASTSTGNSTHSTGAPVCAVNSTHSTGVPVCAVNSTHRSGIPVSNVHSSHIAVAPTIQSVRLIVTPQGLKMIPIGDEGKEGVCTLISNLSVQNKTEVHNKNSPNFTSSAKSSLRPEQKQNKDGSACAAPQLILANIGAQTFVLKVVPNTNSGSLAGVQNSSKVGDSSAGKPVPGKQTVSGSTGFVSTKSSLLIGSPKCNKISPTNKNLAGNVSNSLANRNTGIPAASANPSQSYIKSLLKLPYSCDEKKLLVLRKDKEREKDIREEIPHLNLGDYSDMLSLVRAAVRHHPVVRDPIDQVTHPYCAKSTEHWLRWNIGKRRASEWQRASTVRRYITKHLQDDRSFKGQQLWTTKQIMTWCRFHAYSPHYLEKISLPPSGCSKGERIPDSLSSEMEEPAANCKLCSLSEAGTLVSRVTAVTESLDDTDASSTEEEIEILSVDQPKVKIKLEVKKEPISHTDPLYLPLSDQAMFVQEIDQKIGVHFQPIEIEDGVYGSASEEIIFGVMKCFMEDIVRQAFHCKSTKDRNIDSISVADVHEGLSTLAHADFITNKYMGVREEQMNSDIS
ncbi:uncharacterized protein LOC121385468 [Gigantopelta aegis]|uniref:uncharacterized protein LOC121385468 n=1 Tax=Gigantopelta aegis TaxID=1735272 RepID=UPI001B88B021|nr:uncharacterized protein LOC121385468 [Gigantopelta aegis]